MRLLTKVAVSAVYVVAAGGASIGATAFGVHLATRSPLASATTALSDFPAGTPPGQEATDDQDTTGTEPGGPGGHADPVGNVQHQLSGVE
ncbi:MAG TPA: hypothetical protein VIX86_21900 [Streptosporangiaceae bacterium]